MAEGFSHYVVRRSSPVKRWFVSGLIGVAVLVALWFAFDYGRQRGGYDAERALTHIEMLELRLTELQSENRELRDRVARAEQTAQVDRMTYSTVDQDLKVARAQIYALEKQLAFYRRILEPAPGKDGPQVDELRIEALPKAGRFRFRVTLVQGGKRGKSVKGSAQLAVEGKLNGRARVLELNVLTEGKTNALEFAFKHYQNLEGEMLLPSGFSPEAVKVKLVVPGTGKNGTSERRVPWADVIEG